MILRSSPATREILYIWSSPLKIRSSSWRQYEKKHPQTHGVAMGRKKMAVFLVKIIMAETRERKRYIDDVFSP